LWTTVVSLGCVEVDHDLVWNINLEVLELEWCHGFAGS
jgi:hypothetical protein